MGYPTWDSYVRKEFGYSRSRSYEFLDQARVVRAIRQAAASDAIPDVSAYTARIIKPHLHEVVQEIRERLDLASSKRERAAIVNEAVTKARLFNPLVRDGEATAGILPRRNQLIDRKEVFATLDFLAGLPSPTAELIADLKKEPQIMRSLRSATKWMIDLAKTVDLPIARRPETLREGYAVPVSQPGTNVQPRTMQS
jgi:hypothetical protein